MSHEIFKSLISEMIENHLEESQKDDIVESIFEQVSDETWEAIEEAIIAELDLNTAAKFIKKKALSGASSMAKNALHKSVFSDVQNVADKFKSAKQSYDKFRQNP